MRRSTRDSHRRRSAAAAAPGHGAPCPSDLSDDGDFELLCSDGQCLTNKGKGPGFRIFRQPISYGSDVWYADYNEHGVPNTLRIYRLDGEDRPEEIYKYRYIPEKHRWEKETPPERPPTDRKPVKSRNLSREQPHRILTFPLAVLRWFARWLLWPIADSKWREKLLRRQRFLGLTPIQPHFFDDRGLYKLFGDSLRSVQLRHDGSVLVIDEVLHPRKSPKVIPRRDNPDEPWMLWFGDTLVIKGDDTDAILTFELDHWQQWGPYRHNLQELVGRDLDIACRAGERFLRRGFSFSCKAAVVLLLLLLVLTYYLTSTHDPSGGRNAPSPSQSAPASEDQAP